MSTPTLAGLTVPLEVLAHVRLPSSTKTTIAEQACRMLGRNIEIDVTAADEISAGAGTELHRYWQHTLAMLDDLAAGIARPDATVTRSVLVHTRQIDTRTERRDLADELFALSGHPRLAEATGLLEASPDLAALRRLGRLHTGEGVTTLTVQVPATGLPEQLGGARRRMETGRRITLEASHAAWRDRKVRRLVSVTVESDQVWPRPPSPAP